MINMMYLVLTAMLALNVAAETLEAFRVIDGSLIQTLGAVDSKTNRSIWHLNRHLPKILQKCRTGKPKQTRFGCAPTA